MAYEQTKANHQVDFDVKPHKPVAVKAVCPAAATTRYAIARVGEEKEGRGVSKSCF